MLFRVSRTTGGIEWLGQTPGPMELFVGPVGALYGVARVAATSRIGRVAPNTHALTTVLEMAGASVADVAGAGDRVYAKRYTGTAIEIVHIDPLAPSMTAVGVVPFDTFITFSSSLVIATDGSVFLWTATGGRLRFAIYLLYRIDPATATTAQVSLGAFPPFTHFGRLSAGPDGRIYVGVNAPERLAPPGPPHVLAYDTATGTARRVCEHPVAFQGSFLAIDARGRLYDWPDGRRFLCDPQSGAVTEYATAGADVAAAGAVTTVGGLPDDGLNYVIASSGGTRGGGVVYRVSLTGPIPDLDTDGDGLHNEWESAFGLSVSDPTGADGADGDPDGDGLSNAEEQAAGTHPRGTLTRFFAEGATGTFFRTRVALANPTAEPAAVLVRFLTESGVTVPRTEAVPAYSRRTIDVERIPALASENVSAVIEADRAVVVDRTVSWDARGYGSHTEAALASPSTTWFLAEGSTSGPFALFYLLQNPQPTAVSATVRFLRPLGLPPIVRAWTLPPFSRTTIPVDDVAPELASTDVSAAIGATAPIVVERASYLSRPGQPFAAGHASAGVPAPALTWFFAEGATGPFFDLFLLVANPNPVPATIEVDYLLLGGGLLTKAYTAPADGRLTIWVDDEEIPVGSSSKPLGNVAVSSRVRATGGWPIVVERTMWWPGHEMTADFWYEAHNSPGATATSLRWAFAAGEVGGPDGAETYVLIANPSASAGRVRVAALVAGETTLARTYEVAPWSRSTVPLGVHLPETRTRERVGVLVESLGPASVPIVVERATYASPGGVPWASGGSALAVPVP
jgi:hypothetical protein